VKVLKVLRAKILRGLRRKKRGRRKEIERIEFPIFFAILGWQLRVALVRVRKKVLWPFKRYWQEALALILLICFVFSSIFWYHPQVALGATYYWVQTDWSGGATTTSAVHPTNRTNWTYYYEASSTLNIGAQISLATTTGSITQTSDTDFSQGTRYQTLISGTGTNASIILDPEVENSIQILNPKSEIGVGGIWEVKFTTKGNPKYP
jgi:opacity protein-like surface antigen